MCTELHSSYEDPPDLPAFKEPKIKKRKELLTEALAGAAVAFASAMFGDNQKQEVYMSQWPSGIQYQCGSLAQKNSRAKNEKL